MHRTLTFSIIIVLFLTGTVLGQGTISSTVKFQKQSSNLVAYSGTIQLPFLGYWKIKNSDNPLQVQELYIHRDPQKMPEKVPDYLKSKLDLQLEKERQLQRGSQILRSFYPFLERFAKEHDFIGPMSLKDLGPTWAKSLIKKNTTTWTAQFDKKLTGEFAFLVPGVTFIDRTKLSRQPLPGEKKRLMIELRPYLEDGKHWILYNDGSIQREKIDPLFLQLYGLKIHPITTKKQEEEKPPEFEEYRIVMVCPQQFEGPVTVTLENPKTRETKRFQWDFTHALIDEEVVSQNLSHARELAWQSYSVRGNSPVLLSWLEYYGVNTTQLTRNGLPNQPGANLSSFSILGGRAAVEETLQLQAIGQSADQSGEENVAIETLKGVEVESHPFSEMLQGQDHKYTGLQLADLAPYDHFFVHVAKPSSLLSFLEDGAAFISHFGSVINNNNVQYNLTSKYLSRLGLDSSWLRMFLDSGEIKEMALVFPDLFFIDGTDVTTISRLEHPHPVKLLLRLIGIDNLSPGNVVEHLNSRDEKVYWSLIDDLLLCSSSKTELDKIMILHSANGENSLGKSDEFQYMLTQLHPQKETRLFAYFSDPFIRHLVSPAIKIAQQRRIIERRTMEEITSRLLLAKMDGMTSINSLDELIRKKYLPERIDASNYTIEQDVIVRSKKYGTLSLMQSLDKDPVEMVTTSEAESYNRYVQNYNRYWNRYFDPIAIKIDDLRDGSLEMTTFILPLVDNSIYNGIRELLVNSEASGTLKIPQPSLQPVVMLSLNLEEKGLINAKKFSMGLSRYFNLRLLDDLGPGIHLAIHDSDPVIALGSGDILGAFSGNSILRGRGGMTMFIPVALSVLTRPCTLFVETSAPDKTLATLRTMAKRISNQSQAAVSTDFYQIDDKDEWTMSLNFFGMMKLRYGIEVQGNYLMIRNIPWANNDQILGEKIAPLKSAHLEAFPEACKMQLPGLFAAANENIRRAVQNNMAYLYPLLASGSATADSVEKNHFDIFGFRPVHPKGGLWQWKGQHLTSSQFGGIFSKTQPGYKDGKNGSGLLNSFDNVSLNMQFEDSGLRAVLRWKKIE